MHYYGQPANCRLKETFILRYGKVPSDIIYNKIAPWPERIDELNKKNEFFIKLEKSILKEGFRNPVLLSARKNDIQTLYGGSRVMIAQQHKLDVPALIADYDNLFPELDMIASVDEIYDLFKDKPSQIIFNEEEIRIVGWIHSHLD